MDKIWFRQYTGWWTVTVAGKEIRLAEGGQNCEQGERKFHGFKSVTPRAREDSNAPVADIIEAFLNRSETQLSPETHGNPRRFGHMFAENSGYLAASAFKFTHLKRWIDQKNLCPTAERNARPSFLMALLLGALVGCAQATERFVDVDVGGHRLHLLIVGERHQSPSVVLESGGGGGIGWIHVRSPIAQFAQVITYDRAGIGQSEPGPAPRDARTIARELHSALHQAGVAPPYILVGESLGGLYVPVFAAMFPQETAGLVLVDPTHASPDLCLSTDQVKEWFMTHDPDDWPRVEAHCRAPEGLRSYLACKYKVMETFIETVPEPRRSMMRGEWWAMIDKLVGKSPSWESTGAAGEESKVIRDSIRQAIAARPLPKVPTILLEASRIDLDALPADAQTPNVIALQAQARRWNRAEFQEWIDDTPGAKLVVVQGSGHGIESDRPQAVIDAVREAFREQ